MRTKWPRFCGHFCILTHCLQISEGPTAPASVRCQRAGALITTRAGYDFGAGGTAGGVFIGPGPNDYARRFATGAEALSHHHSTGNALSVTAGRLAFVLDWQGPALAVDSACSSSLVAVHVAAQHLRERECRVALAGGVNVILSPANNIVLLKASMLSAAGRPAAAAAAFPTARASSTGHPAPSRRARERG